MKTPENLLYTKTHEWVKFEADGSAFVGLTYHAQESLGDLVFVNLPAVGDSVEKEKSFADVESVKAVSDVFSPFKGTVAEINEALADAPEKINVDCYGAWLIKVSGITAKEELLSAAQYEAFVASEK